MRITLLLALLAFPAIALAQEAKPNIVLIMADDLGYGDVGFNGGPWKTPTLDQLAKQSVIMDQHYSLPVCSPTRSSLLTGRFNSRFGVLSPQNERAYPFDTVTIAAALKSIGYDTALIGKWHLGSLPEWGPQLFGFQFSYGSLAGGVTSWSRVYKRGPYSQTWHRNGKLIEEKEGHVTDLLTAEAVKFIETRRDGPFLLYVPYTAVHLPIDEPKEWLDLYPGKSEGDRQYGACVSHLDDGVGRILKALDRTKQRDNTIVLFISDNGGSSGTENNDPQYAGIHPSFKIPAKNGRLRGKKGQLYEGGIRGPALIHWLGKLPAGKTETPIHVADWFPTFAARAGFQPKTDLKWDGRDIWPALLGKKMEPRPIYLMGPGQATALRHGDWMLLTMKGKTELYNLADDPWQEKDLYNSHTERVRELQAMLQRVAQRDFDAQVKKK
jgi:arylsulfatase A-like enzyme